MNLATAALTLVLSSTTATTAVPRDLFLDYSACTRGREICAAQRTELRDRLADCEEDLSMVQKSSDDDSPEAGFGLLEVVGVSAIAAGIAFLVGGLTL